MSSATSTPATPTNTVLSGSTTPSVAPSTPITISIKSPVASSSVSSAPTSPVASSSVSSAPVPASVLPGPKAQSSADMKPEDYPYSAVCDLISKRQLPLAAHRIGFKDRDAFFADWAARASFYPILSVYLQNVYNTDTTPHQYKNTMYVYQLLKAAYNAHDVKLDESLIEFPPPDDTPPSSDSDETFFDPSAPLSEEHKTWFEKVKDTVTDMKTIHHDPIQLSKEDRTLMTKAIDAATSAKDSMVSTAKAIPGYISDGTKNAMTHVKDGLNDIWNHATFAALPKSVKDFLLLLLEVIPLAMCDNQAVWLCSNIRMAYTQGVLRTAMVDGVALFVKQILKRFVRATDQPAPEPDDSDLIGSMSSVVAAVHYFAVGWIPDIIPNNLLKLMIGANVAFTLARNFEHFALFILKMVRLAADAVWTLVTGRPWFDQSQRAAIDSAADCILKLSQYVAMKNPTRSDVVNCKYLIIHSESVLATAIAANVPKDNLEQLRMMITATDRWVANNAGSAEYTDMRSPTVIFGIKGPSGCGKTTAYRYAVAALAKSKGIAGDLNKLSVVYDPDINFQAPLPLEARFLLIDDAFLMVDPAGHIQTFSYIGKLGSGTPILQDDPIAPKKGQTYQNFRFCGVANNIQIVVPANSAEPIPRRYIGGDHTFVPLPYGMDSHGHFDPNKVPVVNPQEHLNLCWDIIDHNGVHRNFTQWVDMLAEVDNRVCNNSRVLESSMASLSQTYVPNPAAVIVSPPPRTFKPSSDLTNPNPKPVGVPQIIGIGYKKAKQQALRTSASDDELAKWMYNKSASAADNTAFAKRMIKYMKHTKSIYEFELSTQVMLRDGKPLTAPTMWREMVAEPVPAKIDIKVPPSKWTPATLLEFKDKKFMFKNHCCMYDNYCYRHAYSPCCAWDDDAVEKGHSALAHWVIENPDLSAPQVPYFTLLSGVYSKEEDSFAATAVKGFIFTMGAVTTGLFVINLITMITNSFGRPGRDQAAYTNTGMRTARKPTSDVLPSLSFKAKDQAESEDAPTDLPQGLSHQFILRKFRDNVVPIQVIEPNAKMSLSMLRIVGNLAVTVKHVFTNGATHIALGGMIAAKYPIKVLADPLKSEENSVFVQVWFDPEQDLAWLILPKSIVGCPDIRDKLIFANTTPTSMTGMIMMNRPIVPFPISGELVEKSRPTELTPFPIGDTEAISWYDHTRGHSRGATVKAAADTADGHCGQPYYTTNHRVGRGAAIVGYIHTSLFEGDHRTAAAVLTQENVAKFIERCPAGVLTLVRLQSLPEFAPTTKDFVPNVYVLGELSVADTQFMNTKSSIRPAMISGALEGFTYTHPGSGETRTIDGTPYAPSPIWQRTEPYTKYQAHDHVPDPDTFAKYKRAAVNVEARLRQYCDPKLLEARETIWSTHQALNGVPELGIPKLDWRKALGYPPIKMLKKLRKETLNIDEDGVMSLKLQYQILLDNLVYDVMRKKMGWVRAVAALKEELRKIGKNARVTTTFPFLHLIAMRRFFLSIPSILISGRGMNHMGLGIDLDGIDGQVKHNSDARFPDSVDVDADNYDARKSSAYSSISEQVVINLSLTIFPFLDWDILSIPARWSRICLLIVGRLVLYVAHGMLSGHFLTTAFNCVDSDALLETAWIISNPKDSEGNDISHLFHEYTSTYAYGDDGHSQTGTPQFTNFSVRTASALLGHVHGPGSKGTEMTEYSTKANSAWLKRLEWVDVNGRVHNPLISETLEHIHRFIRGKTVDPKADTALIADACLREWSKLGQPIFEEVLPRINLHLKLNGIPHSTVTYAACMRDWMHRHGGVHYELLPGVAHDQAYCLPPPTGHVCDMNCDHRLVTPGFARNQSLSAPKSVSSSVTSRDPLGETVTSGIFNDEALTKSDPVKGVQIGNKLTTIVADASVSTTRLTPGGDSIPHGLNCFPPSDADKLLGRTYPLYVGTWNTADGPGIRYTALQFPTALIGAIPKVSSTLSALTYMENKVSVVVSVAGNIYCTGGLRFYWLPAAGRVISGTAWRTDEYLIQNAKHWTVFANSSNATSFVLPFVTNRTFYEIAGTWPEDANGTLIIGVCAQLTFNSTAPPVSIPFIVRAALTDAETSGPSIQAAPALDEERGRSPMETPTIVSRGKARDQSAQEEAGSKASTGILDGVMSAVKTVTSFVGDLGPLAELAAFDKPMENATVQPVRLTTANDHCMATGIHESCWMAAKPAYVSADNRMMSEAKPQPEWDDILTIPALLETFVIPANVAKDDVIWSSLIWPTMCRYIDGVTYVGGPLGFYAMRHSHFHGPMNFCFVFYCTDIQTLSVRCGTFLQNVVATVIPDNKVGDIRSKEIDVKGITFLPMQFEYQNANAQIPCGDPSGPDNTADNGYLGTLHLQCTRAVSTQSLATAAPVTCEIWYAGAPGAVLSGMRDKPVNWVDAYVQAAPAPGKTRAQMLSTQTGQGGRSPMETATRVITKVAHDQACMRDFFGNVFKPVAPSTQKAHHGMVDPDTTRGPVDLMKRFHHESDNSATPYARIADTFYDTSFSWLQSPFAFWSGSLVARIAVHGNGAPGVGILTTTREHLGTPYVPTNADNMSSMNGLVITDLSKNAFHTYTMPFNYVWWAREYDYVHGDGDVLQYVTRYRGPGTNIPAVAGASNIDAYIAAGDDFALYHFIACPFTVFLVALNDKVKKMKRVRSRSRTPAPPPPVSESESSDTDYENAF